MIRTPASPAWPARRILLWGGLWGLFLSAAEFFVIAPLHSQPLLGFLLWWLTIWPLPLWCAVGSLLLLIARRCEPHSDWLTLAAAGITLCLAFSALQAANTGWAELWWSDSGWYRKVMASAGYAPILPPRPNASLVPYNAWVSLFYGGLLVAAYVLMVRTERMRSLLRDAALARSRTEALIGQTRLQGLQAQVDPQLLLTTLDEVQALYRREPARADALLERLVEFLRAALPGLKQRRSTLQAELFLARAYAELQALLPGGRRWEIDWPQRLPDLSFPSLLLLPLLTLPTRHDAPRLVIYIADDRATLQVQGLGQELPPRIAQHTQACLQELLGPSFRLRANESPQTQLTIELDINHPAKETEDEHRSTR